MREFPLGTARPLQHLRILALRPIPHAVHQRPAPLHGVFAQAALMAGVIIHDPFPPKRSHGIEVESQPAPTG